MEREHQIHRAFAALHLGLLFAGLGFSQGSLSFDTIVFGLFLFILRLKFWYDDEQYFSDIQSGKLIKTNKFYFGFLLGLISWIIWCFAFLFVKDIELSSLLMFYALLISTIWIFISMLHSAKYREQIPWIFFNIIYLVLFLIIFFRKNMFENSQVEYMTRAIIILQIVIFCIDLGITRILESKRQGN